MENEHIILKDGHGIQPINRWHSISAQPLSHFFIYSTRERVAFAACGHRALVTDLIEDCPKDACYKCELVLLVLSKGER